MSIKDCSREGSIDRYVREINQYALLTRDEELRLGKRKQANGDLEAYPVQGRAPGQINFKEEMIRTTQRFGSSVEIVRNSERIREAISLAAVMTNDGQRIAVTISAGVACATEPGAQDAIALYSRADRALYQAKEMGRDKVVGGESKGRFSARPDGGAAEFDMDLLQEAGRVHVWNEAATRTRDRMATG